MANPDLHSNISQGSRACDAGRRNRPGPGESDEDWKDYTRFRLSLIPAHLKDPKQNPCLLDPNDPEDLKWIEAIDRVDAKMRERQKMTGSPNRRGPREKS